MAERLPLENIRVIEMSHMIMGPSCGMVLAQLGAEVIKVEPPRGDKTRDLAGMGTAFFPLFNRGKRSVVLDLASEKDRAEFHALLQTADVFIENFRDGQLARQGIAAETLRARHPRLIVAGHKGFLSGPYEHRPALDEVVQMMTGLAMMTGSLEEPKRVGSSANDIMGGMFGAIGILAALLERGRTGRGKEIRVGLFENCLLMVAQHMVQYELTGAPSVPMPERVHAWPIYDRFRTRDGKQIFIAVVTDGHWQAFCETFDLPEFLADPSLGTASARIDARHRTVPVVAERIAAHDLADLEATLDRLNIPFARINRPEDMFHDPHVLRPCGLVASNMPDGRRFRAPALPLELDGAGLCREQKVPALGEDTAEVLAGLPGASPADAIYPPGRVSLREVGLRDGLQMVRHYPSTEAKLDWIAREYAAGIRHFELGSFLPAARYPEFADIGALIRAVADLPGAHGSALVPNRRGAQDALASGVSEIHCVVSASEAHNRANLRRPREETLREIGEILAMRDALRRDGAAAPVVGVGIAMSFGCSIAGPVAPDEVLALAERLFGMGADVVSVADTVGFAGPKQVAFLAGEMRRLAAGRPFGVHLHDTRGMGMANAAAALDAGVRVLDASLGGLGGCPAAPGATGNIVMEDLVFLCQTCGIETGVDQEKLMQAREVPARAMPDEPLHGAMARAGPPSWRQAGG